MNHASEGTLTNKGFLYCYISCVGLEVSLLLLLLAACCSGAFSDSLIPIPNARNPNTLLLSLLSPVGKGQNKTWVLGADCAMVGKLLFVVGFQVSLGSWCLD